MVVILFFNNAVVGKVSVFHRAHFLIFIAGFLFALASVLYFRNNWKLATLLSVAGLVLPFFRPIY